MKKRRKRRRALGRPFAVGVADAAELIGCSAWTVRRLVESGRLATVPDMGRRVLIPTAAIERHVNSEVPA